MAAFFQMPATELAPPPVLQTMRAVATTQLKSTFASESLVRLEIASSLTQFCELESEWNALFVRAGLSHQVFGQFNWNYHWAQHFARDDKRLQLAVVTGRLEGRLVMVWPTVIQRAGGLRVIAWMGEPVSQYGDVLVENGPDKLDLLRAGWDFLSTSLKPDLVRLNKTRADSAIAPLLKELGATSTQQLEAPYLALSSAPTFSDYEQRYSSKTRKNRRRLARRLEEQGGSAWEVCREGLIARERVAQALELKRTWLKTRGLISPALSDPRTLAFFADAACDSVRPTQIRVSSLMIDTKVAAVEIAFACRDRLAIHIMAFDEQFEKNAPGMLLLERMIGQSLESGVAVYDMMAPGDGYKKDWADESVRVDDLVVPVTRLGRLYANGYLGYVRPRIKAAITSMPKRARRALSALVT